MFEPRIRSISRSQHCLPLSSDCRLDNLKTILRLESSLQAGWSSSQNPMVTQDRPPNILYLDPTQSIELPSDVFEIWSPFTIPGLDEGLVSWSRILNFSYIFWTFGLEEGRWRTVDLVPSHYSGICLATHGQTTARKPSTEQFGNSLSTNDANLSAYTIFFLCLADLQMQKTM